MIRYYGFLMLAFGYSYVAVFLLTSCGRIGMPPHTDKPVRMEHLLGTWGYHNGFGDAEQITFLSDGTFTQIIHSTHSSKTWTNAGKWRLDQQSYIVLSNLMVMSINGQDQTEVRPDAHWWVTEWYTEDFAPFGGDSSDPDHWTVFERK